MDKRGKMIFAGLCLCVLLVGCAEDRDVIPVPDMQEILDDKGIEDIRYNSNDGDTSQMGGG